MLCIISNPCYFPLFSPEFDICLCCTLISNVNALIIKAAKFLLAPKTLVKKRKEVKLGMTLSSAFFS